MKGRTRGFIPISIDEYARKHVASNKGDNLADITSALRNQLEVFNRGVNCSCGEPIWVIGSALAGSACFTCITGEAEPSDDYEIDEALKS
ncbi:MAG: hypothetical protein ABL998_05910 [Planctomycetota bacterium]